MCLQLQTWLSKLFHVCVYYGCDLTLNVGYFHCSHMEAFKVLLFVIILYFITATLVT